MPSLQILTIGGVSATLSFLTPSATFLRAADIAVVELHSVSVGDRTADLPGLQCDGELETALERPEHP